MLLVTSGEHWRGFKPFESSKLSLQFVSLKNDADTFYCKWRRAEREQLLPTVLNETSNSEDPANVELLTRGVNSSFCFIMKTGQALSLPRKKYEIL